MKGKSKRPWQGREEGMRPEEWHHEGENSPSRRTTGHEEIGACRKGECMGEKWPLHIATLYTTKNYCYTSPPLRTIM
jgi:hypothetical protein